MQASTSASVATVSVLARPDSMLLDSIPTQHAPTYAAALIVIIGETGVARACPAIAIIQRGGWQVSAGSDP
jgi:hypothetical protein